MDGIASGHREIGRQIVEPEPADVRGFVRLAIAGLAADDTAEERR